MRYCGRSARRTEHTPSPGFRGAPPEAERTGPPAAVASKWTPTEAQLGDYVGSYPLTPNLALRVFATGAKLFVQGTNQRSLELASVERDVFVAESVSAEIDFERDAGDKVVSRLSSSGDKSCRVRGIETRINSYWATCNESISLEGDRAAHPEQRPLLTAGSG